MTTIAHSPSELISTHEQLREVLGFPGDRAVAKELRSIDRHARYFIEHSPFALLSSSSRDGRCDVSPKGDVPGFVKVLDDQTLLIPDRPGNRRGDTLSNLLENPHLGMLFLIPEVEETLRVNGHAVIATDSDLVRRCEVNGKLPKLVMVVDVQEVYFHCAKAFKRSGLWQPGTWLGRGDLPTLGQIMIDQITFEEGTTAASVDCDIEEGYVKNLY